MGTELALDATDVSVGTHPAGSAWRRNPIPACNCDRGFKCVAGGAAENGERAYWNGSNPVPHGYDCPTGVAFAPPFDFGYGQQLWDLGNATQPPEAMNTWGAHGCRIPLNPATPPTSGTHPAGARSHRRPTEGAHGEGRVRAALALGRGAEQSDLVALRRCCHCVNMFEPGRAANASCAFGSVCRTACGGDADAPTIHACSVCLWARVWRPRSSGRSSVLLRTYYSMSARAAARRASVQWSTRTVV